MVMEKMIVQLLKTGALNTIEDFKKLYRPDNMKRLKRVKAIIVDEVTIYERYATAAYCHYCYSY